jgi:hypothetical protein
MRAGEIVGMFGLVEAGAPKSLRRFSAQHLPKAAQCG